MRYKTKAYDLVEDSTLEDPLQYMLLTCSCSRCRSLRQWKWNFRKPILLFCELVCYATILLIPLAIGIHNIRFQSEDRPREADIYDGWVEPKEKELQTSTKLHKYMLRRKQLEAYEIWAQQHKEMVKKEREAAFTERMQKRNDRRKHVQCIRDQLMNTNNDSSSETVESLR